MATAIYIYGRARRGKPAPIGRSWIAIITFLFLKPKAYILQSIRGHIHEELTSWMFYRKLAADCSRANIALHGFAMYVT